MKVTRRQQDTLRAILAFYLGNGRPPTMADLVRSLGVCRQAVARHVEVLWKRGFLEEGDGTNAVRLASPSGHVEPLLGFQSQTPQGALLLSLYKELTLKEVAS